MMLADTIRTCAADDRAVRAEPFWADLVGGRRAEELFQLLFPLRLVEFYPSVDSPPAAPWLTLGGNVGRREWPRTLSFLQAVAESPLVSGDWGANEARIGIYQIFTGSINRGYVSHMVYVNVSYRSIEVMMAETHVSEEAQRSILAPASKLDREMYLSIFSSRAYADAQFRMKRQIPPLCKAFPPQLFVGTMTQ
jgi:hypothetical protein